MTSFNNEKYIRIQSEHIKERIAQFGNKLYLELGGKLFDDFHASRVLPGFLPDSKLTMLTQLRDYIFTYCSNRFIVFFRLRFQFLINVSSVRTFLYVKVEIYFFIGLYLPFWLYYSTHFCLLQLVICTKFIIIFCLLQRF